MISSLFGDVEWQNQQSMRQWLMAHDTEHRLIRKTIATANGVALQPSLLSREPDDDWMGRHALIHLGFEKFYVPNSTAPAVTLMTPVWEQEGEFYDWHTRHNLIHQVLRQQLGIYGSN